MMPTQTFGSKVRPVDLKYVRVAWIGERDS